MKDGHLTQPPNHSIASRPLSNSISLDDSKPRWPSSEGVATGSPGPAGEDMDYNEDLIEDDYDSYDELFTQHFTNDDASPFEGTRAISISKSTQSQKSQKAMSATKRFLLPSKSSSKTRSSTAPNANKNDLPWTQRYAPENLEELAVHKRKVQDVEQWLGDALIGRPQRGILILKGPAGSGKTTTVALLADKLKFNILEWKPPTAAEYGAEGYVSLSAKFDEFLSRGHNFSSLDLDGTDGIQSPLKDRTLPAKRRIILIEEFPTLTGRNAFSIVTAFRVSLLRHISVAQRTRKSLNREFEIPPIVMVVSETLSNTDSSFDNFTVNRLLGREICNHPSTRIIEFNSIAPTIMCKALDLVMRKSSRTNKSLPSTLEGLSQTGDIRNAVASLEFASLGTSNQGLQLSATAKRRKKTFGERETAHRSDNRMPDIVSQRENSLDLFHAVGKIVYNKRNELSDNNKLRAPSPPDHLHHLDRPRSSQVHVSELLEEIGTDIQSFITALHENYVASCNGPSFAETVESCIGALSDSDLLCTNRKGVNGSQTRFGGGFPKPGAGVDLLRQEELSYEVAARGLLFALPSPVNRQLSPMDRPKGAGTVPHKLSFPPVYKLQRHMEAIRGALDQCIDTLFTLCVWPSAVSVVSRAKGDSDDNTSSTIINVPSRSDLLLYQLPFMLMILPGGTEAKSLKMIATFQSLKDRSINISSQLGENPTWGSFSTPTLDSGGSLGSGAQEEQLVLSDDDIVDDGQ
ncbi:Rad17 cell cycle checkpoint protein-domain-containing protein [Aspergillus heterothallicus]